MTLCTHGPSFNLQVWWLWNCPFWREEEVWTQLLKSAFGWHSIGPRISQHSWYLAVLGQSFSSSCPLTYFVSSLASGILRLEDGKSSGWGLYYDRPFVLEKSWDRYLCCVIRELWKDQISIAWWLRMDSEVRQNWIAESVHDLPAVYSWVRPFTFLSSNYFTHKKEVIVSPIS